MPVIRRLDVPALAVALVGTSTMFATAAAQTRAGASGGRAQPSPALSIVPDSGRPGAQATAAGSGYADCSPTPTPPESDSPSWTTPYTSATPPTRRCWCPPSPGSSFGQAPRAATADRGCGEAAVDRDLEDLGVARVVIPRKGRLGAARQATQRSRAFRHLVKWRTGSEARISCLKMRLRVPPQLHRPPHRRRRLVRLGCSPTTPPRSAPSRSEPNDNARDPSDS
jgi:hypothetical protein